MTGQIYAGVAAIVSAIIIGLFAPLVVNAIEFTIGLRVLNMSIDIPVSMLRVEGIVLGVIGQYFNCCLYYFKP